jgi:hypothetical protein
MPRPTRDELKRLHFVNALFSQVTGDSLFLAQQIVQAIAFSLSELEIQTKAAPELARSLDADFYAAAAKLLEKFCLDSAPEGIESSGTRKRFVRRGFFHWDAANSHHAATPLFARVELMAGLKELAPFEESTLLVTNLRPALLPPGRRMTAKRTQEYRDALEFIRELAAKRTRRHAQLQLLFL